MKVVITDKIPIIGFLFIIEELKNIAEIGTFARLTDPFTESGRIASEERNAQMRVQDDEEVTKACEFYDKFMV